MKKLILLLLILLTSCTATINGDYSKKEKEFLGYITDSNNDMVLLLNTEVYLTTVNNDLKEQMINTAVSEITKYHKLLDSYHKYTDEKGNETINIAILNESIGKGPIKVDPIIIDALKEAINLSKLSQGYFNFTIGKLTNLYKDKFLPYDSINVDPEKNSIKDTLKGIIPIEKIEKYIIIDDNANTVEFKKYSSPYLIDLGAFSKGYIIDKVYNELIKYDTSFLLNAGSSSIVSYTNEKENINWTISLNNPENKNDQLFIFSLNNGAVSTSGDYENYYYLEDGTRRHHILDPFTGYSENYYNSITLISSNAGIIDALSTALFNINNQEEFINIIKNVEKEYNTNISYTYVQSGSNIFMDKDFSNTIIKNIPISNHYTFTTTIIEE